MHVDGLQMLTLGPLPCDWQFVRILKLFINGNHVEETLCTPAVVPAIYLCVCVYTSLPIWNLEIYIYILLSLESCGIFLKITTFSLFHLLLWNCCEIIYIFKRLFFEFYLVFLGICNRGFQVLLPMILPDIEILCVRNIRKVILYFESLFLNL